MVDAATISNVILAGNGYIVTIYTQEVEYNVSKMLNLIKPGQSTKYYGGDPKEVKIIDLMQVEERYTITGYIDSADVSNLKSMDKKGGALILTYDGDSNISVNIDKLSIKKSARFEQDEREVRISCVVGSNI